MLVRGVSNFDSPSAQTALGPPIWTLLLKIPKALFYGNGGNVENLAANYHSRSLKRSFVETPSTLLTCRISLNEEKLERITRE